MIPTIIRGLRKRPPKLHSSGGSYNSGAARQAETDNGDFSSWMNEELIPLIALMRQALNYTSIASANFPTAGTGTFTTVWASADISVGSAVLIDATIVGVASTARSAFKITGLFYSTGTTAQEGATVAGYTQNAAGFAVQFLVVSNHVELQVKDAGGLHVDWDALITAQEAT